MMEIFTLPARFGGLGIGSPSLEANEEYACSIILTAQLVDAIFKQERQLKIDDEKQKEAIKRVNERKKLLHEESREQIYGTLSEELRRVIDLATEKGASVWLSSLPIKEYTFFFNKQPVNKQLGLEKNFTEQLLGLKFFH